MTKYLAIIRILRAELAKKDPLSLDARYCFPAGIGDVARMSLCWESEPS